MRGHQARNEWRQQREAVILLQAYTRGMLVRRLMKIKVQPVKISKLLNCVDKHLNNLHCNKSNCLLLPPKAPKSPEEENQELVALDLQRRLLEIVEFQEAFDLMKAVRRQEEEKQELDGLHSNQPPKSDADEDDGSAEFSFYKFSVQHFQGYMSHRHITQRLRQPLLKHDDEGDALVRAQGPVRDALFRRRQAPSHCAPLTLQACLTVWWIILRFMEDMPEPKASARPQSPITRNLPHRRARKLSNLVGLDQVPAF